MQFWRMPSPCPATATRDSWDRRPFPPRVTPPCSSLTTLHLFPRSSVSLQRLCWESFRAVRLRQLGSPTDPYMGPASLANVSESLGDATQTEADVLASGTLVA